MAQNHTHEYDCRICGAHLDSQNDLNQHMREKHAQQGSSPGRGQSGQSGQGDQSGRIDRDRTRDDRNRR